MDRIRVEICQRFLVSRRLEAERELGFRSRDPYETLHETVAYLGEKS